MFDFVVVGCGYAGAVSARIVAENLNKKILILEKRSHIAGNMYDDYNEVGVLVHRYGPHISAMNDKRTYDFLSRFTDWVPYEHKVLAQIDDKKVPLPINLNSIKTLFPEKYNELSNVLISEYGFGSSVPVLSMMKSNIEEIKNLADFLYRKVYLEYTIKMWDLDPKQIDASVTGRIPFRVSFDDRHFLHKYQVMPKNGFTKLFENMLDHPNIKIELGINAKDRISVDFNKNSIFYDGKKFDGKLIYTGSLDELCGYEYGRLPYRSLKFKFDNYNENYVQPCAVLNWPDKRPETRRTEMKRLTGQILPNVTTTITEYPGKYNENSLDFNEPYYPIIKKEYLDTYRKYVDKLENIKNFYYTGRLACYKYYNMEDAILSAMKFVDDNFIKEHNE